MSKLKLKKELKNFDRDQLIQLILDVYSARKEAKAYFDFFVDPNVRELNEKYKKVILKELSRGKYRDSKARISKIKQILKEYASFGVDGEARIEMALFVIKESLLVERKLYFSESLYKGFQSILESIVTTADQCAIFDQTLKQINEVLDGSTGTRSYTNFLRRSIGLPLK